MEVCEKVSCSKKWSHTTLCDHRTNKFNIFSSCVTSAQAWSPRTPPSLEVLGEMSLLSSHEIIYMLVPKAHILGYIANCTKRARCIFHLNMESRFQEQPILIIFTLNSQCFIKQGVSATSIFVVLIYQGHFFFKVSFCLKKSK